MSEYFLRVIVSLVFLHFEHYVQQDEIRKLLEVGDLY